MKKTDTKTIGIIGGGQLALLLAESLTAREIHFICLSKDLDSPMMSRFPEQTTSEESHFRSVADVFTLENELHSTQELRDLLQEKIDSLFPDLRSYDYFSNKINQRKLFDGLQLNSPKWMALKTKSDLDLISKNFSYPYILKLSRGGYDGKGVRVIEGESDLLRALDEFKFNSGVELLIEEKINIKLELAQGFIRNNQDAFTFLPLVQTLQEKGICQYVLFPAEVSTKVEVQCHWMLLQLMKHPLHGIFNFEFFVDNDDCVFINEGAPRPHNSQHLTINASNYSQFDLLSLYLNDQTDLPQKISTYPAVMVNLIGQEKKTTLDPQLPSIEENVELTIKLYDKSLCLPGRKMGHINLVDPSGRIDLKKLAVKMNQEYRL